MDKKVLSLSEGSRLGPEAHQGLCTLQRHGLWKKTGDLIDIACDQHSSDTSLSRGMSDAGCFLGGWMHSRAVRQSRPCGSARLPDLSVDRLDDVEESVGSKDNYRP
jgi:hypothetical protein